MSNADLTQDRELVELAKELAAVNYNAWFGERPHDTAAHWSSMGKRDKSVLLAMADAARTHLGSGFVLPPATEENAERLAHELLDRKSIQANANKPAWSAWVREAKDYLEALHAAFAPTQPKDDGKGLWIEPKDEVTKALDAEEKPVRDAVSRDEQREYEALVLQFAAAMAVDDSAEHVINLAVELADQYLEWRKMEREEFKRCKS